MAPFYLLDFLNSGHKKRFNKISVSLLISMRKVIIEFEKVHICFQ